MSESRSGAQRSAGKDERVGEDDLRKKVAELERALERKTYELEVARNCCGTGSERARRPVS